MNPYVSNHSGAYVQMKLPETVIYQNNLPNYANLPTLHNGPLCQKLQAPQTLPHFNNLTNVPNFQDFSNIPSFPNSNSFFSHPNSAPRSIQQDNISNLVTLILNNPQVNQELQNQMNNLFLSWKLQNNLQAEVYKNQMSQLVEMQNRLIALKTLAVETTCSSSPKTNYSDPQKPSPEYNIVYKQEAKPITQAGPKKTLKNQIRLLVYFMLKNFGRVSEGQIEQERAKYRDNVEILAVFDALVEKYTSTIKTKEEMIKYTLRKAFKFIKNELKKEMQIDTREASTILCKRYFEGYTGQIPEFKDEDDFLQFVLPFR